MIGRKERERRWLFFISGRESIHVPSNNERDESFQEGSELGAAARVFRRRPSPFGERKELLGSFFGNGSFC